MVFIVLLMRFRILCFGHNIKNNEIVSSGSLINEIRDTDFHLYNITFAVEKNYNNTHYKQEFFDLIGNIGKTTVEGLVLNFEDSESERKKQIDFIIDSYRGIHNNNNIIFT